MYETGNIGMIGGFLVPEVNRLMNAIHNGRARTPDAEFQVSFIGSRFDPPKAKETAYATIENGADCSMPSASASRTRHRSRPARHLRGPHSLGGARPRRAAPAGDHRGAFIVQVDDDEPKIVLNGGED